MLGQAGLGVVIGAVLMILQGRDVGVSWLLGVFVAVIPIAGIRRGSESDAQSRLDWRDR